jgi:hypothetical protein
MTISLQGRLDLLNPCWASAWSTRKYWEPLSDTLGPLGKGILKNTKQP